MYKEIMKQEIEELNKKIEFLQENNKNDKSSLAD